MINLKELIKFNDQLRNFLSSCQKKLCNKMKNLTQKLQDSYFMKNKSKISFFKEICYIALNENESETMNDLFIDNDSNSSSSDDFILIISFTYFALSVAVLNATAH